MKEQSRNRKSNRRFTYQGRTMILQDWSRELGISYANLWWRLNNNWTLERVFVHKG